MVNIILYIAGGFIALSVIFSLIRFMIGPKVADRIISFDVMTISSLSIIGLISYFSQRGIYIDVAIVYALLSFLSVIVIAKYLEKSI